MFRFTLTRFLIAVSLLGTGFGLIAYAAKLGLEVPWRAAGALIGAAALSTHKHPIPAMAIGALAGIIIQHVLVYLMNVAILE